MIYKKIRFNQYGLTLLELLATIVISSIIVIFTTSLLLKSFNLYETISTENQLRDEADLILVQLYRDLYTTKMSEISLIKQEEKLADGSYKNSYIVYKEVDAKTGKNLETGFKNDKLYIKGKEYSLQNKKISINTSENKSSIRETSKGVYEIKLVLYMENKSKSLEFVNEVSTINDKELETNENN